MTTHRPLLAALLAAGLAGHGVAAEQATDRARGAAGEIRFHAMDADNDGVITRAEWRGSDEAFRQEDTNKDGVLSGVEVAPEPSAQSRLRRRDELVAQFTRADRDSDARLRANEWTADLGSFEQTDRNGDKMVTRAEFLAANRNAAAENTAGGAAANLRRGTPAFQTGFDKGLVDGRQAGKEDRNVNGGKWDLEGQRELEEADAGYDVGLGRRVDYQAGYRAGFRRAYAEGFGPR
jgi:EF hand